MSKPYLHHPTDSPDHIGCATAVLQPAIVQHLMYRFKHDICRVLRTVKEIYVLFSLGEVNGQKLPQTMFMARSPQFL